MTLLGTLPDGMPHLRIAGAAAGGLLAGTAFYGSLWWTSRSLATQGATMAMIIIAAVRFAAVIAVMGCFARQGTLAIIAATVSFVMARQAVVRLVRGWP